MKIAFVSSEKLPVPAVSGGAVQIYIEGILPFLSKHHEITVFSGTFQGMPQDERQGNIRYIRIAAAAPGRYINAVRSMLDSSYDLVHIFNRPLWLLSLCESHPQLVYSLSLHNDMFDPDRMTISEVYECVKKTRFITAVSRYIADRVITICPPARDKVNVIYSGIDTDKYKPTYATGGDGTGKSVNSIDVNDMSGIVIYRSSKDRNSKRNDSDTSENYRNGNGKNWLKKAVGLQGYKVVLFVGRLTPEKGVHVLIRAMKDIMDERDRIALIIVGSRKHGTDQEDEYSRVLKKQAKELKGTVIFTGFLPPGEIIDYYKMADLFVCPSQWNEPLARVLYEAMASGLPVITTDRGGNAEVVSDRINGIVIKDHKNHWSLAQAISMLLDNMLKAEKLGSAGRARAVREHSWERVAHDIDRIIYRYLCH